MSNVDSLNGNSQLAAQLAGSARAKSAPATGAPSGNNLPAAEPPAPAQQPSAAQIESAVAKLSDFVQSVQRDLSFSVDDNTGRTVIVVKDRTTDEVVRQIPSEDLLELAQNLQALQEKLDSSKGNLLEVRV